MKFKQSIINTFFSKQQKELEKMENKNLGDQIKMIEVSTTAIEFYQLQIRRSKEIIEMCKN